jgi:hypothetical protein
LTVKREREIQNIDKSLDAKKALLLDWQEDVSEWIRGMFCCLWSSRKHRRTTRLMALLYAQYPLDLVFFSLSFLGGKVLFFIPDICRSLECKIRHS